MTDTAFIVCIIIIPICLILLMSFLCWFVTWMDYCTIRNMCKCCLKKSIETNKKDIEMQNSNE